MKIVVTGSLGNISKPLTQELVQKGHAVTVVTSRAERKEEIETIGAKAAVGTLEDVQFLTDTFTGADAVYSMEPPVHRFFDHSYDLMAHIDLIAKNFEQAIRQSGVKKVVHLSSIGAHTNKGNGILAFHYEAEKTLERLPSDVSIVFMRPVGFYYNLLNFINPIKTQGMIASNYGGADVIPWVSPIDIASAIAEEIQAPLAGRKVRYVASEEITCNEVASILGSAIGKPDLKWVVISNEQLLSGMKGAGMNVAIAEGFVEMNAAQHDGSLFEDYYKKRPVLGKTKLKEFAKDFAAAYNK